MGYAIMHHTTYISGGPFKLFIKEEFREHEMPSTCLATVHLHYLYH